MIELNHIVIATDLSDNSLRAVRYGCQLAQQFAADVHLLHIVCHPFADFAETCRTDYGRDFNEYEQEQQRIAEQTLGEIVIAPLTDAKRVVRVAHCGLPVTDIPRYAVESGADLLVLGTHGHSGLRHMLMGSVCEAVVRHCQCPVLSVRSE